MKSKIDCVAFGLKLYKLRSECGLTLERASHLIGCAPCSLCTWESGKYTPQLKYVAGICKTYDVSADWLLGVADCG